jgi:hypothetical protein
MRTMGEVEKERNSHSPDLVVGAEADPLGDGTILLLLLGKNLLDLEGLLGRLLGERRPGRLCFRNRCKKP